jgi:outer membrane protein assembly factor BamB
MSTRMCTHPQSGKNVNDLDKNSILSDTFQASPNWRFKTQGDLFFSPNIKNNILYFGTSYGEVYAFDLGEKKSIMKFLCANSIASRIVVYNDIAYFGSRDNFFYAIDSRNGTVKWKYKTDDYLSTSLPLIIEDRIYFVTYDKTLHCLNVKNGKLNWKYKGSALIALDLMKSGQNIQYCDDDGRITTLDKWGKQLEIIRTSNFLWLACFNGDIMYYRSTNSIFAENIKKNKMLWECPVGGHIVAIPFYFKNTVYVSTNNKAIAIDSRTGKLIWSFNTDWPINSKIITDGTNIFVTDQYHLYALDNSGHKKWKLTFPAKTNYEPAIYNGKFYIGLSDSCIYEYNINVPK